MLVKGVGGGVCVCVCVCVGGGGGGGGGGGVIHGYLDYIICRYNANLVLSSWAKLP